MNFPDENRRLSVLHHMQLLDTHHEAFFENVVDQMAISLRVPIALVSLVDEARQWFKACRGLSVSETCREVAFCATAIKSDAPLVIKNALEDKRFADNPLVTGAPHIRAYLGVPIKVHGERLGTVCAIDQVPREWTPAEIASLTNMAAMTQEFVTARATQLRSQEVSKLENELVQTKMVYKTVFSNMVEGVVIHDREGNIVECNPASSGILRLSEDQMHGTVPIGPSWRATDVDGRVLEREDFPAYVALRTGAPILGFVLGVEPENESKRWLSVNAQPIGNPQDDDYRIIVTFADITSSQEREKTLCSALEEAEKARLEKKQFIANISHDIRTPINGILGLARVLHGQTSNPDQKRHLKTIVDSGHSVVSLLNDLLDISRIDAGCFEISPKESDLRRVIHNTHELWRPVCEAKSINLLLKIRDPIPSILTFDPTRVQQCLTNLVSNAIKFTDDGEICIDVFCDTSASQNVGVKIIVEDTGMGIAAEQLPNIFAPYQQADESISPRFGGSGLGLSLVRELAQMMGGTVDAESTPGKGSKFTLSFNASRSVQAGADAMGDLPNMQSLDGKTILVADDQDLNRLVCELILRPRGANVVNATNGLGVLEILKSTHVDAVLLDIHMPRMSGLETVQSIRALKSNAKDVPIILVTADVMPQVIDECIEQGADTSIIKPFHEDELIQQLLNVLVPGDAETPTATFGVAGQIGDPPQGMLQSARC